MVAALRPRPVTYTLPEWTRKTRRVRQIRRKHLTPIPYVYPDILLQAECVSTPALQNVALNIQTRITHSMNHSLDNYNYYFIIMFCFIINGLLVGIFQSTALLTFCMFCSFKALVCAAFIQSHNLQEIKTTHSTSFTALRLAVENNKRPNIRIALYTQ